MEEEVKTKTKTEKFKEWYNNNKKIVLTVGILLTIALIGLFIYLLIQAYNKSSFSVSPNSYLLPDRVPSNPLSYIVYPFRQLLNWDDLPTGAREMTTKQGTGLMTFKR